MSAKAVREVTAKQLVYKYLESGALVRSPFVQYDGTANWESLLLSNPWLNQQVIGEGLWP